METWTDTGAMKMGTRGTGTPEDPLVPWLFKEMVCEKEPGYMIFSWCPVKPVPGWEHTVQRSE